MHVCMYVCYVMQCNRANIKHVAADLLSQAEHGADSQAVLVAMRGTFVHV